MFCSYVVWCVCDVWCMMCGVYVYGDVYVWSISVVCVCDVCVHDGVMWSCVYGFYVCGMCVYVVCVCM